MDFWIRTIPSVLEEDPATGWKVYMLYKGSSGLLKNLSCHVAVLSEGRLPHPLHQHLEEELILILSGEVDHIMQADNSSAETTTCLKKGALIYLAERQPHTIRSRGPGPAISLVFKWRGEPRHSARGGAGSIIVDPGGQDQLPKSLLAPGFSKVRLFETPTRYLSSLRAYADHIEPGSGCKPHTDPHHDVAIVLLSGHIDTLGGRIAVPSVLFFTSGTPHWITNIGQTPVSSFVFEFHREEG